MLSTPVQGADNLALVTGADNPQLDLLGVRIPRMAVVSPGLWRGAQPPTDALPLLRKAGVKTIINLDNDELAAAVEEKESGKVGLRYFHIPLTHFEMVPKNKLNQIMDIIDDPVKQPVFIHCRQGQDRTGALVAMYRIKEFGWSPTQAYREMLLFGYHPFFIPLTQSVWNFGKKHGHNDALPPPKEIVDDLKQRARNILNSL